MSAGLRASSVPAASWHRGPPHTASPALVRTRTAQLSLPPQFLHHPSPGCRKDSSPSDPHCLLGPAPLHVGVRTASRPLTGPGSDSATPVRAEAVPRARAERVAEAPHRPRQRRRNRTGRTAVVEARESDRQGLLGAPAGSAGQERPDGGAALGNSAGLRVTKPSLQAVSGLCRR